MDRDKIWKRAEQLAIDLKEIELENLPMAIQEALCNMAEREYQEMKYNELVELWD